MKKLTKIVILLCQLSLYSIFSLSALAQNVGYEDQVQRIYIAYYGRPADPAGLDFWATRLAISGGDLNEIIEDFGTSVEYDERYGSLDNEDLVNNIYIQLLGRNADIDGLEFYVGRLDSGTMTLASIALNIIDGVDGGDDELLVANKMSFANVFTEAVEESGANYDVSNIDAVIAVMDSVSSTLESLTTAESEVASLLPNGLSFALSSSVMVEGDSLPISYTCDDEGVSPPLEWSYSPADTQSYAIVMHHVAGPNDSHWYWVLYNISADVSSLAVGETAVGTLGTNSVDEQNSYTPPCSQGVGEKLYTFTVYALSSNVEFLDSTTVNRDTLLAEIENITLESATLNVTYERSTEDSDAGETRCELIKDSVTYSPESDVTVTCDETFAYISSDTYPSHGLMTGIVGTNEQIPVPAVDYAAPIKLEPVIASSLTTIDAAVGVAINGVPIYDYSSQGELDLYSYSATSDTVALGQLDNCGGHAGRGDDYHYHASPNCMIGSMPDADDSVIIGWGYDGYPLYGNNNPDGSAVADGELDVCNGQVDDDFGYRYHTSTAAPYIIQCLVGEVDTSILPRVSPLSGDTTGARANLTPPEGGVENLTHTIAEDGTRTMTYTHNASEYYVIYSPASSQTGCYDFEQKTVSNGGVIETGTFCRDSQIEDDTQAALQSFKLEAWSDNWFAAYLESDLIIEDSVSINTERSFNSETITFSGSYPLQLNFVLKDFKENDTGLEYIGENNQQMGDGGFIAQITDTESDEIIAVSNSDWKCEVIHEAPLDKSCENESNPIAGVAPCTFSSSEEPTDWKDSSFNDSLWDFATQHSAADVGPKDGFDEIDWNENAQLIWGSDLETNNTLICRVTIGQPE